MVPETRHSANLILNVKQILVPIFFLNAFLVRKISLSFERIIYAWMNIPSFNTV